jgi:hypothetical protein
MPPVNARLAEYAVPTAPFSGPAVVTERVGATVNVTVAVFVASPIELAVTVILCAELVDAGAV